MTFQPEIIQRPYGKLFVYRQEAGRFPDKPLILLLHGAFEKHKKLLPWAELWRAEYDVALADLPGHGASDAPAPVSLPAYIDEVRWLVAEPFRARQVVIVGDSFGGLLGVALGNDPPGNFAGVVTMDSLLSTEKQWSIQDLLPRVLEGQPEGSFRRQFAANVMGMGGEKIEDQNYRHFFEGAKVPVLMLAGEIPLGQRRDVQHPSLLDDADRVFLRGKSMLGVIAGVGHQLVLQRPAETFAAAKEFVQKIS
ncbi:MAG: alpha/beta fold hydrolase [Rhodospirillaceae bacterium]